MNPSIRKLNSYRGKIILMGVAQFLLTPLIVGWCWWVSYACRLHRVYTKDVKRDGEKEQEQIDNKLNPESGKKEAEQTDRNLNQTDSQQLVEQQLAGQQP